MQRAEFESAHAVASYDHEPPPGWSDLIRQCVGDETIGQPALDIGCGPGRFLPEIAKVASAIAIGIDSSSSMLLRARATFGSSYGLVLADAERLPFRDGSIGIAVLRYVAHHASSIDALLSEAGRVLHRGGRLVLESADAERLRLKPEYSLFPALGAKELHRWPSWAALAEAANAAGLQNIERKDIRLVRALLNPSLYLERTRRWARDGGGTSFWRQLDRAQRRLYLTQIEEQVSAIPMGGSVPVLTESLLLVARKNH